MIHGSKASGTHSDRLTLTATISASVTTSAARVLTACSSSAASASNRRRFDAQGHRTIHGHRGPVHGADG